MRTQLNSNDFTFATGGVTLVDWYIADFKAIEQATVRARPLTVLTGANSSGKSSLLQALLFLAQSVDEDEPMLNGPLVRLGLPKDVIRSGASSFTVGLRVQPSVGLLSGTAVPGMLVAEISYKAGKRAIEPAYIIVTDADGRTLIEATSHRVPAIDQQSIEQASRRTGTLLRVQTLDDRPAPKHIYFSFRSVLPDTMLYKQDEATVLALYERIFGRHQVEQDLAVLERFLEELRIVALHPRESPGIDVLRKLDLLAQVVRPERLAQQVTDLSDEEYRLLLRELASYTARNDWAVTGEGAGFGNRSGPATVAGFAPGLNRPSLGGRFADSLEAWTAVTAALRQLALSVEYLGPLREEPNVATVKSGSRQRSLPVGARGEYTADIVSKRAEDLVEFNDWLGNRLQASLIRGVSAWISYLGVGDAVKVLDHGKLGRGLNVRMGKVDRDLTTIGVGASQLLPVVVACLSAPRNALVLIEQPELHLHPAVQSRLADFFLLARPDISFILETHSEYLLTRIRRRVAESVVSAEAVDISFAEQDEGGVTRFRRLGLTELGDLTSWPQGFFDAQDDDARALIVAVGKRLETSRRPG